MESERWEKCTEIFDAALERPAQERAALLEQRCQGDEVLRGTVELLLRSHDEAGGFIESPAFETVPELLLDDAGALVGEQLGRYRVESVLGIGGMGVVYLAHDEGLGRKVGLKLLPQSLVANKAQLERLKREARAASALNHPNIVTIHEIGQVNSTHYIATEFIEGTTLRERMARGPIPPNEALEIALQIASALSVAHAAGIVHRDIKPENIMLRPDGYVKVLDFGIAKFTQPEMISASEQVTAQQGMIIGTTRYMSPEQARGLPVDSRTDVWSLGVVLYEMLAGERPFDGATPTDVIISIAEREPVPLAKCAPEVPIALEGIVQKALAKERKERHQTAKELLTDLKGLTHESENRQGHGLKRSRVRVVTAALCLLIVVGLFSTRFFRRAAPLAPHTEIKSLAVLPLENLSGDPAQEYFADGLTDALIGDLASIASLRVISRTSAMHYKGTKQSLPQIAQELKVEAVVEGSVQRSDGRVRVRAQLIHAATDRHLWAQTYEHDLRDVLDLQSEIARSIAREVQSKTTPVELARLTSRAPVRPKAFDDYLKGRYLYWNKRTVENLDKAIAYLESAIREDPTYALPYVGVADCYNALGAVQFSALTPPEARRRAEAAALKALELDPTLAEAHSALGYVRHFSWDWAAAEQEFQRAIELNPNYANAHNYYASYLMSRGRTDEVFAASNRARELDPLSLAISAQRGFLLFLARRYDESIEQLRGIIATDPNHYQAHWFLAHTYAASGQLDEAIAASEKATALGARSPGALGILGLAYGLAGKKDEATKIVNELLELNERRYVTPAALVFAYTGLGDKDQAFAWMEKSYQERSNFMVYLKTVPLLDPLRSDPRFAELVRRVGLPQ